jgi:predicted GIY-YIG superfamily endonuclease
MAAAEQVMYTSDDAAHVLWEHSALNYAGYGQATRRPHTTEELSDYHYEIRTPYSLLLIARIANHAQEHPVEGLEHRNSYGFKHDFEKALTPRTYVSNGQGIAGMLLAGYVLTKDSGYNATFEPPATATYTLYRFWSGTTLLYVGISNCLPRRMTEHNGFGTYGAPVKDWWTQATQVTLEHYADKTAVRQAEEAAIRTEHPVYNIQHNKG